MNPRTVIIDELEPARSVQGRFLTDAPKVNIISDAQAFHGTIVCNVDEQIPARYRGVYQAAAEPPTLPNNTKYVVMLSRRASWDTTTTLATSPTATAPTKTNTG